MGRVFIMHVFDLIIRDMLVVVRRFGVPRMLCTSFQPMDEALITCVLDRSQPAPAPARLWAGAPCRVWCDCASWCLLVPPTCPSMQGRPPCARRDGRLPRLHRPLHGNSHPRSCLCMRCNAPAADGSHRSVCSSVPYVLLCRMFCCAIAQMNCYELLYR